MNHFIIILFWFFSINLFSQKTIKSEFKVPFGFEREITNDYHQWIINQPLKDNNKVLYSNGQEKIK